ncbi:ATP-binding protein [Nonlabens agnitus]|nr:SbcC/MukB-like Walker B domain-containing protein [Nonlabens agnitus]
MEILNWGTFDESVFRIEPKGNNSLLTGANGSGKTTFIDALLTLIVPLKNNRFYNQSSGAEKKGDRTERTYVLGHYGDIQKDGELSTTTQSLRDTNCYSILLANFENTDGKSITLFQVRWFAGNDMKRSFGIAYQSLEIEKDFTLFDGGGVWKKLLEAKYNQNSTRRKLEFFDGPTKYAERITKLFGMRSVKALNLFNQLVGIKVLGDLDGFIRNEMLESKDAEEEYKTLDESFATLMSAKRNIEKAQEQIKQLKPIDELAEKFATEKETLTQLEKKRDTSLYWFAEKGKELSEVEQQRLTADIEDSNSKIKELKSQHSDLQTKFNKVEAQIQNDEVGQQIEGLKTEKANADAETTNRKKQLESYNTIASSVKFTKNPSEKIFQESFNSAETSIKEIKKERPIQEKRFYDLKAEIEGKVEAINGAVNTVTSLRNSGNNITGRVSEIRNEIIDAIGVTREDIPFVGELIAIKETETAWELAIEKALHSFGLKLLVSDAYYEAVNNYVNKTNLNGKISYERIRSSFSIKNLSQQDYGDDYLLNKLDFKTTSPYQEWVEQNVTTRFNFLCTNDMSDFAKSEKAITTKGLTKYGRGRHEKDDRPFSLSKERYVLGWDNTTKISYWRTQVKQLREDKTLLESQYNTVENELTVLDTKRDNLNDLIKLFPSFDIIDWSTSAKTSEGLKKRIENLKKSNNKIKALEDERDILKGKLDGNSEEQGKILKYIGKVEANMETAEKLYNDNSKLLDSLPVHQIDISDFELNDDSVKAISYTNFEATKAKFQEENNGKISTLTDSIGKLEKSLGDKMRVFKHPLETIRNRFPSWEADVSNLSLNVDLVSAFQEKYNELIEEDLPKYEKKFSNYLEETLTNKVGEFNEFFDSWSEEIKENVSALNDSLKQIDFETVPQTTYIQLVANPKKTDLIIEFKEYLLKAIPNFKEIHSTVDGKKVHFENAIEPFINKLRDFEWRSKVMDVRTWYEYKAEEFYREDDTKKKTYAGMGQLSGGEKAQLTYTVLGSAIAYQFGLTKTGTESDSFRFIAIDEAFKAQDSKKANYLINLCKQLHLQLLVVTPSDNIDIVEDHISFVHFASRKNDRNSWLYDMTIEQFQEEREKYVVDEV